MAGGRRGAAVEELHYDILKEILIRVTRSSHGAKDFVKAIAVCKAFQLFVEDQDVLRAVAFDDLSIDGHWEHFQYVRGLVFRCAKVGNKQAEFILAKIILASGSQLWKAKKEAKTPCQDAPSSSSSTQPKDSTIPKPPPQPTTLASNFLETFLPNSKSPDFMPSHLNPLKTFLSRATFREFTDMITHLTGYVHYLVNCKDLDPEDQEELHYSVEEHLDMYQSLWDREACLESRAVDFLSKATWTRVIACTSLQLLELEHELEEISHSHHHPVLTGRLATLVEDLGKELASLRALKAIIDRLDVGSDRFGFLSSLPRVEEVATMIEGIEQINEEASGLMGCRDEELSKLEALLKE